MEDIIGKKFNRLTILKADEGRPSTYECQKYYLCKCDCGNIKSIRIDHVKTGRTKSCGCYAREHSSELGKAMSYKIKGWNFRDLRGQKFGKLMVVELVRHGDNTTSPLWKCRCECGAETNVFSVNLYRKHTTSCGCSVSKGEKEIGELLKSHGIRFMKNKAFDSCRFDNGTLAKFDFFIENSYLLEYDGLQHFEDNAFGHRNTLAAIKQRDEFKNQWCRDNNIILIRIPYTKIGNITLDDVNPEKSKYVMR
jgi:hypothetical protein